MKKNFLLVLLACIIAFGASAQQPNPPSKNQTTFRDVKSAFENYWKKKDHASVEREDGKDGEWQQYKRWEWFAAQRTFPSGNFPSQNILFTEYQKYKTDFAQRKISAATANWSFIGPHVVPANGGGSGRINCITIDPANDSIIWVGAACGGLWKSTDRGNSWSSNTDLLPALSVSDIVIDSANPQNMYIATGDKYGIYYLYEVWGHYSAGILKSTDGGVTWNPTGMTYNLANGIIIQRLILDTKNPNNLFAATNAGIFQTANGGSTWANIRSGKFYDIEFNPGNHNIIYAGDSTGLLRSINYGASWNYVSGVTSAGRTSIAVSPANPNAVYAWCELGTPNNFYYSNNAGVSFTLRTDPSGNTTPYGYYDMVLEVSPIDEKVLFTGGLTNALSTDGGNTWITTSDWNWPSTNYVHADHHAFQFLPGSSTTIFACNDGGIFTSTDQGTSWTDLSGGIDIKEYYRMSASQQKMNLMYAGAQDNGTDQVTGLNTAAQVYGADGEDCLVDFTNDSIVFVSSQGGNFLQSTDGANTFSSVSAVGCDWTTPIVMDATNHNIIYIGGTDLYQSTDNGNTWNDISAGAFDGTCIYSLRVSFSNPNYIYVATFGNIYRTTNGGSTWSIITNTLPVGSAAISGIAISSSNPDDVWVTFSGFSAGNKVFYTNDGGTTWTNVSATLPNIPVNCIEYQNGSNDLLYIGTDLGVFYIDATMNNWAAYNTGLPNVIIDDLEISYPFSKLRAATFGRGLWASNLQVSTLVNLDASAYSLTYPANTACNTAVAPVVSIRNAGQDTLFSVELHYRIDAQPWQLYNWSGMLPSLALANITLPTYTLTAGTHTLYAYTASPNSSADQNNLNDSLARVFKVVVNPDASPDSLMYPAVSTCSTVVAPVVSIKNMPAVCSYTLTSVELHYHLDAQPWQVYNWTGSLPNLSSVNITLPSYTLAVGTHTLYAYTAKPNSFADPNPVNDTLVTVFTIFGNITGMSPPLQQGFVSAAFPPVNWQLNNPALLWSRINTVGGYSLSNESARADFYNVQAGSGELLTPYIDFSNAVAPIRLYFDVAYATYDITYIDSLVVDIYDDCWGTGKRIYARGTSTLATAPPVTSQFIPTATQWRTDSIHLDSLAGKSPRRFRFIAISGFGNELYLDNINLSTKFLGVEDLNSESGVTVFPNPNSGEFGVWSSEKINGLEIYNVLGGKIYEAPSLKGVNTISISLPSGTGQGIYFFQVKTENGIVNKKIIINK
ncbi:MAG: T9SS type A sorting domain-containing protein [Bacteroidetes bacterium]|nr:T9SS type A sorting domain-containing protein [Bacteroidota bacterium]